MQVTQYERYRGSLAGLYIDLAETGQAMAALGHVQGTTDPETRAERMRLSNIQAELEQDLAAALNGAEAELGEETFARVKAEAEIIAEEWLADPKAPSSIPRAIIYRENRAAISFLQHYRKTPDERIEWEIETRYPRRTVASGTTETMHDARKSIDDAMKRVSVESADFEETDPPG